VVAVGFGAGAIGVLRKRFHQDKPRPEEFEFPNARLGAWLHRWQFAIFEVFYCLREPALEAVRKAAFGRYDWTQGNAIEVLCRWAAEGMDRERTLGDLKNKMPKMRSEALEVAAARLLPRAERDSAIREIVEELRGVAEFEEACGEEESGE
jgi:hypothetical protein